MRSGARAPVTRKRRLPELIHSFEPALSDEQSARLDSLYRNLDVLQSQTPMVLEELPLTVPATRSRWRFIRATGDLRVAYHEAWRLERPSNALWAWDDTRLCLSDRSGLTIIDLETGHPLAQHPDLILQSVATDAIAVDLNGYLHCFGPHGTRLWQQRRVI